jgi:hypothetical protein
MFIYIDESGNFTQPFLSIHSYSCVGALTIPHRFHGQIIKSFNRVKKQWHCNGIEPKGKNLTENQVASVVELLIAGKAKFHVCVTDMVHNSPDSIKSFQVIQTERLLKNLSNQHHPDIIKEMNVFSAKMKTLPDQLFVQLIMMTELVHKQLQDAVIHFALSDPSELGNFRWTVDRKGVTKTPYEHIWSSLLSKFIQGRQFTSDPKDKILCISDGDYTYFEKFCDQIDKWPEHLPARDRVSAGTEKINVVSLHKIINDTFAFGDSSVTPGLQLVDIVTNAFKRAISGKLQIDGWQNLGRLMFRRNDNSARLVHFGDSICQPVQEDLCAKVLMEMTRLASTPLDG